MLLNSKYGALIFISGLLLFSTGCANADNVVNEPKTVSEEMAAMASENAVPEEAYSYCKLKLIAPESFIPDNENNADSGCYYSPDANDLSFISYSRSYLSDYPGFDVLTEAEYEAYIEAVLESDVMLESYEKSSAEAYKVVSSIVMFDKDEKEFRLTEYFFITNTFVFCVDYFEDVEYDNHDFFEKSMNELCLERAIDI